MVVVSNVLNVSKVIRRVRRRLGISQEALSRRLNATKGAIQHWERGRNRPDLARLLGLRRICPPGPERKELDFLIKRTQGHIAPLAGAEATPRGGYPNTLESVPELRKENLRLQRQIEKLEATLRRRDERVRLLGDLARELQREVAELRGNIVAKPDASREPSESASA